MTDTSSVLKTHSTPQPFPVTAPSLASPLPNGSLSDTNPQDEEDYTIKCICAYVDDDGNTVYCEKCDTWQHIECYYHGEKVPEVHFCADCFPRKLDAKRATERQKRAREQIDGGDRKIKARPSSKSHKKKTKEVVATTEQVNGWHTHERRESSVNGRDQPPPAKKPKTSHRASASIVSMNGHPTESRKRALSNVQSYPSPSKSPQELYRFPSVPTYTPEFLELYDQDDGEQNISPECANVYTISASNSLSAWRMDPSLLAREKGESQSTDSPFVYSDLSFDPSTYPPVSQERTSAEVEFEGMYPTWKLLRLQDDVKKDALVGEIRGQVGLLKDYCDQGSMNRWTELRHPDPFVFFHPHMNIYIDSRREGTQFRYLRRSCRPNVTLRTFVSADGEYHHCFVAKQDIAAGSELTTHWYMDRSTFNPDPNLSIEDARSKQIAWASKILANFGDCACDRSQACYLAQLDYRYSPKSLKVPGRKKKTKTKHTLSPLSTGQATNSRAGSEAVKGLEDDDQDDRRSASTSSHSHPDSRDMTPTQLGSLDANPVLPGSYLTAREQKKIADLEKAFERADKRGQVQKKKKRTSGGATLNTPGANSSKKPAVGSHSNPTTPGVMGSLYADLKSSRPFSGSPPPLRPTDNRVDAEESPCRPSSSRAFSRMHIARPSYVDAKIQTDPEENELVEMPPTKKRKFLTPTQQLLRKVQEDRLRYEQMQKNPIHSSPTLSSSPADHADHLRQAQRRDSMDVEMKDAGVSALSPPEGSPVDTRSPLGSPQAQFSNPVNSSPPFPLPSQAAHSQKTTTALGGPRLHLSTLPPVPSFAGAHSGQNGTPISGTSIVSTPSAAQSPFALGTGSSSYPGLMLSNQPMPSPARKKLSLGDYMSRKNLASTPAAEKSQVLAEAQTDVIKAQEPTEAGSITTSGAEMSLDVMVKPDDSIKKEAIAMGGVDGTAVEHATKDDSDYSPPEASPPGQQPADGESLQSSAPASDALPATSAQSATPGSNVAPEVANVLAQLLQMQGSTPTSS